MITQEQILNSLKHIIDPDLNKDIVSLGFVRNIKVQDNNVSLDINLTTPACPIKAEFQNQARVALEKIPGIKNISVQMTAHPTASQTSSAPQETGLKNVRTLIAVSSCKGGVGKSTMSAALAQELSRRGNKVGLLDVDIHGPSLPTLFNLSQARVRQNERKMLVPLELNVTPAKAGVQQDSVWMPASAGMTNNLKLMSFGFLLGDAPAVMRGPMVTRYVQQLLLFVDWGELDYLFIDMPPGTGDVQLTITQTIKLTGAVIITTRQALSLVDVARGILMFEKVSVPILGVIENMAYFICDACDKKHFIFGEGRAQNLQERFGVPTLAEVPLLTTLTQKFDHYVANSFIQQALDSLVRAVGRNSLEARDVPAVRFDQENIYLRFSDGKEWMVENRALRASCECALCVSEVTGKPLLNPAQIRPDIVPTEIVPLGRYAIGVTWNDGHSSGIYPYKKIEEICKVGSK